MQGTYRITLGDYVYEYKNVITNAGRLGLLKAISGQRQGWALSIIAGVGNTAASASDTALEYLYSGGDVSTTIIDPINEKLYFKSTLPIQDQFTIYELGCFASDTLSTQRSESGGGTLLTVFSSDSVWTDVDGTHTLDTDNNRISKDSIAYTIAASDTVKGYLTYISDLGFIPSNASFKLAYFVEDIADLVIRFKVDDSNYYEYDGWTVTDGYHIDSVLKSSFTMTGAPTWETIQSLELEATATASGGTVSVDALRYELPIVGDSDLLSRVVLGTPQTKVPGVPLDIEYLLEI